VLGQVSDSTNGRPIPGAELTLLRGTETISSVTTDDFGHYVLHDLEAGQYTLMVRMLGFRAMGRTITVTDSANTRVNFAMHSVTTTLTVQQIQAAAPLTVDTRTGNQHFKQDDYHGAPSMTTSSIVQQSVAGAARAPTGEVHIRGQHAEYTYYVDGVPVAPGISGSLNELFDPSVVNTITFITGAWDAEYGNKNAAIVDVATRIPTGPFHANVSGYAGSFNTTGQSGNVSGNSGPFGFFLAGSHQLTDMRREPVVFDTTRNQAVNFSNHGEDVSGFGKLRYTPSPRDLFDLTGSLSRTTFDVPFDSTGGVSLADKQHDVNSFVNLGYHHHFGEDTSSTLGTQHNNENELFAGVTYRHGSLQYAPGLHDTPSFVFYPDTTPYNLSERRDFTGYGAKVDYTHQFSHAITVKTGATGTITTGQEDFTTLSATGTVGPTSDAALKGHDIGLYAQTSYFPVERFEIRAGLRYDAHTAPFAGTQTQVSPRIRLNFFPNAANTLYLYYGRQFLPTNVEDLRAVTSVAQGGVATSPTLPERDQFYEAGYLHRFPFGVVSKFSAYRKRGAPGIDDNTVPGSAIVTSVNIATVRVTGLEGVLELRPHGPISGYVNLAVAHAYGRGPITGGFFPTETPDGYFDLDHDQRISGTANLTYTEGLLYVSATGTYGSGLTNGADPDASYSTGLFAMNRSIKVAPSYVQSIATGYTFPFGRTVVRPELFVDNLFDKAYLLKGQFFSGPSVGRPRTVQMRVSLGI